MTLSTIYSCVAPFEWMFARGFEGVHLFSGVTLYTSITGLHASVGLIRGQSGDATATLRQKIKAANNADYNGNENPITWFHQISPFMNFKFSHSSLLLNSE